MDLAPRGKNVNSKLIYICLFFLSVSCEKSECDYVDGLKLYFKNVHSIDLTSGKGLNYYYMVPLESCEGCIYQNLKYFSEVKPKRITIVFVGENPNDSWADMIEEIRESMNTLNDPEKNIYRYETGLRKPLLVLIQNGKCVSSKTVNDFEIREVFSSLELGY